MNIQVIDPFTKLKLVMSKNGLSLNSQIIFENINGAYRVLREEKNYTENFGLQWNTFAETQIDKSNNTISRKRFFAETLWDKQDLTGNNVLEVGSGAGRFSEVILNHTKANLYSVDYSSAVEANFKNNGHYGERLKLFQASIYDLPFEPSQFDKVLCLGVLQHTPDFKKSIQCLAEQVKPGGELIVDFYPIKGWWTKLSAKYMLRPFTKNMSHQKLLKLIDSNIDKLIKSYEFLHSVKLSFLTRFLPICDIYGTLPYNSLDKQALREWCVLDTFDIYSPEHDHPQKISTVKRWFEESGMNVVWADFVKFDGFAAATVRGIKPK